MPDIPPLRAVALLCLFTIGASLPLGATSILFIGGSNTPTAEADDEVMTYLEQRYGAANVSYLEDGASRAGDEDGFDLIIISSTVSSGSIRGKFHDSAVPVLNWESVITDNDQAGEFGVTTRLNESESDHRIRIIGEHVITAGFSTGEIVQLVNGAETVFWSVAPEAADVVHLAEDDDNSANKFLSVVEEGGALMGGGSAPARRVIFGLKGTTFSSLTEDGRTLFGQAVDWAAAGALPPQAPTVINSTASGVGASSATIGGEVTDTGGVTPVVTLYWGDNDGGTNAGSWDESFDLGQQGGLFISQLSGLQPGTTYYFRSFASNPGGSAWAGSTASFTSGALPGPPSVVNLPASAVSFTSAQVQGEVVDTGGESPSVTMYFGTNDGATNPAGWDESVVLGAESGVFANSLFNLSAGTTYYYRSYVQNGGGWAWAPTTASFQTPAYQSPTVITGPATGITGSAARLSGEVTSTGGDAPSVTLYWGGSDGGSDPQAWEESQGVGEQSGEFELSVTGLLSSTTYYVRAFAQNSGGATWAGTTLQFTTLATGDFEITEFMAANDGGQSSNPNSWWPIAGQVAGRTDDWIEIHNRSASVLDLGGWHLTDNPGDPTQWTFPPGTNVPGGGYLVVYASGDNARDLQGNLHTNFALSSGGEYLGLVTPGGVVSSEYGPAGSDYPGQDNDISYGLHPVSEDPVYFFEPTPGSANDSGGVARVADTKFDPDRGYYSSRVMVTITSATPGAEIYYTTDGSSPLNAAGARTTSARLYTGPLAISRTTPLRAAALKAGLQSSNVDSHTYILLNTENVGSDGMDAGRVNATFLQQRQPRGWGNLTSGDYEMDTDISQSTSPSSGHPGLSVAQAMLQGMRDIPTVAVSMSRADFSGGNGIYTNSQSKGFAWERDCAAEFIPAEEDWRRDWGENCGIRVQGGASRNPSASPKHSLSFRFRDEYGKGRLRADLFEDSPIDSYNVLVLRAGYNNSWIHRDSGQRGRGSMIRDQWVRESLYEMGHEDAGRGIMVHLFVNGLYWGVHNLCERQDAAHYATYNGGDEDLLDARNGSEYIDGNATAWNAMRSVVSSRDWEEIQQVLDVDTYIDYQIINRFGANSDLKSNGNWRAAGGGPFRGGRPEGMMPWKVFSWDAERTLESPSATNQPLDPLGIRTTMDGLDEYRLRFADRIQKHFYFDGALTPEACEQRWMKFASSLDRAIIAESARWGDHRRGTPYSREGEWLPEQARLRSSYFPVRNRNVFGRYRSSGFYPSVPAPNFVINGVPRRGGVVPSGSPLTVTASATVYYTLDGSDPRLVGGAVNPEAISVGAGGAISLPSSGLVRARARSGSTWSAIEEGFFFAEPLATPSDLAISEIHYHPVAATYPEKVAGAGLSANVGNADLFEFVEIENVSGRDVNLAGAEFEDGIALRFGNAVLPAGGRVVVVRDPDVFALRYPGVVPAGTFSGALSNDGERIVLRTAAGVIAHDFVFNDVGDWPTRADGLGSSLELVNREGDYNMPASWRPSSEYHGSPGAAGSGPDGRVVINEVLSHSSLPAVDQIELHNRTGEEINVGGWFLSDGAGVLQSFKIPASTALESSGYLVFGEEDFNSGPGAAVSSYGGTVAAGPTTVTTSGPHALSTGDLVTISGYGGIASYDGSHLVRVTGATTFEIDVTFLDDDEARGSWRAGRSFALNSARGDEVWLVEGNAGGAPVRFVDQVRFDGARDGESLGRWPDGSGSGYLVSMVTQTLGATNSAPQVGPVILSEVMYHPAGGSEEGLEYVEICNTGDVTENLNHWKLRGGVDFEFTSLHGLSPGAALVVVGFDPDLDPVAATGFRSAYGISDQVVLVGPFRDGPLRNDRGSIRLQRPDNPPPGEPGFHPAVTEDLVNYFSSAPWPTSAGGGGNSLNRAAVDGFGALATSWTGLPPSLRESGAPSGYAEWRDGRFGPGNPPGSGPLEDFDLDDVPNLLEYALGLDPRLVDGPAAEIGREGDEVVIRFEWDTARPGVTLRVETSTDLVTWTTVPDILESAQGTMETRVVRVALAAEERLFLRLAGTED